MSAGAAGSATSGVLAGVRVLDFTNVLSGPTLTRLMVEMGADVIKVELPPTGDIARALPYSRDGRSAYFVQQNRGKRSLFCDVKDPRGRELIAELVGQVDVFVQNFSPGAIERLGFGYDEVAARHPRIVYCSISAFGATGPLADQPGYDGIAQAYAGVTSMIGDPGRPPAMAAVSPGDVLTGVHGLAGVCAALFHRERTGQGQKVEVSLLDSYLNCHEVNLQLWSASGGEVLPTRSGSVHPVVGGAGIFEARDGFVMLAVVNDRQWLQLCLAIRRPDLADDERFATAGGRSANRDALNQLLADWLATQPGRDVALAALSAERVPAAPVLTVAEAAVHPHMVATRSVRTVHDDVLGPVTIPGVPIRFSAFPTESQLDTAPLGAHNEEIVRDLLGWPEDRYQDLVAAGVLRQVAAS